VSSYSRRQVEKKANDLLSREHVDAPPVPVQELAASLGYQVIYRYFDDHDLSGTVIRDRRGTVMIGINTLHAPVRQRFSIAHEIGHAIMHLAEGEDLIVDPPARSFFNRDERASLGEDSREIEANQFAAALLMPAPFIGAVARDILSGSPRSTVGSLTEALAGRFRVSPQAMKFRLVNLGVIEPD
jgi:Zn-dependent peptidase ImmA (M78 family)